jgi:hypothetical protein
MNLQELLDWHLHNAKEAENEGENDQALLHFQAVAVVAETMAERQRNK